MTTWDDFVATLRRLWALTPDEVRESGAHGPLMDEWVQFRDHFDVWLDQTPPERAARLWPLIAPRREQSRPPHVFKPGRYKTRDGREAVVLCDDAPGSRCLVGYFALGNGECVASSWTGDGKFMKSHHVMDLMPPEPEQVVRWVCRFRSKETGYEWTSSFQHATPAEAQNYALKFDALLIAVLAVLKPGQFDDESTPDDFTRGWNEALEAARTALKPEWTYYSDCVNAILALKRSAP